MAKNKINFNSQRDIFNEENIQKCNDFASWAIWYPDLFLDLNKPEDGGLTLHSDERILLRLGTRFASIYGCFPRGYGKTIFEVLGFFIVAVRYPNIQLAITAQTKENAAELLRDKFNEIVRYYPFFLDEIEKYKFSKGEAEIQFKNNSIIDNLANAQSSKGQRRKRLNAEESGLLNNDTFEDAIKPIVEVGRYTCGKLAVIDPEELNQQINFFTTPTWRGSDEHQRSLDMMRDMIDLKGKMVVGSDWMLACWNGRGSSKSQIIDKMRTMSPIAFDQNYGGKWTGATNGALVSVKKLLQCRTLTEPLMENDDENVEIYMGVDVARSQKQSNNQSSISVIRVIRSKSTNLVENCELVNVFNISNTLNFTNQALIIKRTKKRYNAKAVVVDGNGLGAGLIDELLKDAIDPNTGDSLGCWATINTDKVPQKEDAERCLFDLKAQTYQNKLVTNFIDMVDSQKLRLLEAKQCSIFDRDDDVEYEREIEPFIQTDMLFGEISNLKIKFTSGGNISVEQSVSRIDKDRFSALAYVLFYINEYTNKLYEEDVSYENMVSNVSRLII